MVSVGFCWYSDRVSTTVGRGVGEAAGEYKVLLGDEDCDRAKSGLRKISGMLGRSRGTRILNPDGCEWGFDDGVEEGLFGPLEGAILFIFFIKRAAANDEQWHKGHISNEK